jgi:RNA polymerase sigma-70 factor (ECF subfamily)
MPGVPSDSSTLQACLARVGAGDAQAFDELVRHALARLQRLTRSMLRAYPGVRRWEETDDVLQNALLRLQRSLAAVGPESGAQFFGLAAAQIRRELIDLARHYYGPQGAGAHHASAGSGEGPHPLDRRGETTHEPRRLAEWGEFHECVAALPAEEREVFDLLWYHGLSQAEAAALLQVAERTVKRRWRSARLLVHQALKGELP